jgi:hypothetical protein
LNGVPTIGIDSPTERWATLIFEPQEFGECAGTGGAGEFTFPSLVPGSGLIVQIPSCPQVSGFEGLKHPLQARYGYGIGLIPGSQTMTLPPDCACEPKVAKQLKKMLKVANAFADRTPYRCQKENYLMSFHFSPN